MRLLLAAGGSFTAALVCSLAVIGTEPGPPPLAGAAAPFRETLSAAGNAPATEAAGPPQSSPAGDEVMDRLQTEVFPTPPMPAARVRVRHADGRPASGVGVVLGQEDEGGEWRQVARTTAAGTEAVAVFLPADLARARGDLDLIAVPDLLHVPAKFARIDQGSWSKPVELRLPPCRELLVHIVDTHYQQFAPGTDRPLRLSLEPTHCNHAFADTDKGRELLVATSSASFGFVTSELPLRLCMHSSDHWRTNWPPDELPQWEISPSAATAPLIVTIALQPGSTRGGTRYVCGGCGHGLEESAQSTSMTGRVVDGCDRPVADAIVTVAGEEQTRTDAMGCFDFTVATTSDEVVLEIAKQGHLDFRACVGTPVVGLRVVLPRRGTVRGRVLAEHPDAFCVALVDGDSTRPDKDGTFELDFFGVAETSVQVSLPRDPLPLVRLGPYRLTEGSDYTNAALAAIDLRGLLRTVAVDLETADGALAHDGAACILPGDGQDDSPWSDCFRTHTGRLRIPIVRRETELMVRVEGQRAVRFRPASDHMVLRAPPLLQVEIQVDTPAPDPAITGRVRLQHKVWEYHEDGGDGDLQPMFALAHTGRWLVHCTVRASDSSNEVEWQTTILVLDVDTPQRFRMSLPAATVAAAVAAARGGENR